MNPLCQRWQVTEKPRGERDLAAMILLVADSVLHPRQAPRVLSVELSDRLQQQRLPGSADLPHSLIVRTLEQSDEFILPGGLCHLAGVLLEESG